MKSRQGIINYPIHLHLVGHFRILYHDAQKHEYQVYLYLFVYSLSDDGLVEAKTCWRDFEVNHPRCVDQLSNQQNILNI
jgi:hypothetical protein